MLTDLSQKPIATVLKRLSAEGRSGDLQVNAGPVVKTVFFDHGRVVFAASNLRKDRLGEALLALGRITDDDFARAAAIMKDQKRRLGEALIAAGVLDKAELGTSVARQVRRIALSLFEFTDGVAAFEERPCPIPLEYMVSLSIHHLVYDGIKLMRDEGLILTGVGALDRRVHAAPLPPFAFDARECPREEAEMVARAHKPVTLRALAWGDGGLKPERLRAAYALTAAGVLVDAEAQAQAEEPIVQTETGMFLLSVLRRRPDPSAREAIRQEVAQELDRSARLDREKWLKVSSSAPREELAKALEEKMERYHALLDAVGDAEELRTDIELILGRASSLLRIARQEAKPQPSHPAPRAPGGFLIAPPSPAGFAIAPPADPPSQPPEPASLPPTPRAPAASEKHAPETPVVTGDAADMGASQANYLLMEAEVRMTVADYANAVRVYAKLVDLLPNVAAYHAKLAIAMACYPRTVKQAEREFLEAIRLDPKNADYHYQLGLYYKTMRLRARAVIEMRAALSINPRHRGAREELEILSPRDSALRNLKKLFQ
jgi:tetratricopeptide (TPR) repeat protein